MRYEIRRASQPSHRWWQRVGAVVTLLAGVAIGGVTVGQRPAAADVGFMRPVILPVRPCRLFDTRPGRPQGLRHTPLGPGEIWTTPTHGVNGDCSLPSDTVGVVMNVTAMLGTTSSFARVWNADDVQPTNTSSINWQPNQVVSNSVTVRVSLINGQLNFFNNSGTVHLIGDVTAFLVSHNHDDRYYTKDQTDTRIDGAGISGWVQANGTRHPQASGFTSTRLATGHYRVVVPPGTLTGAGISFPIVNCVGTVCFAIIYVVSPSGGGGTFEWLVRNASGTAVDADTVFYITQT